MFHFSLSGNVQTQKGLKQETPGNMYEHGRQFRSYVTDAQMFYVTIFSSEKYYYVFI